MQTKQEPSLLAERPDISLLKPEILKQWHHAKNQHLGNILIQPNSSLRVWWICDQCPCGVPHEWQAHVHHRQYMDYQCPSCCNRKLCKHNSLSVMAPCVAVYWDSIRNVQTADEVLAHSHNKGHWMCPGCSWRWEAIIAKKVATNSGCPKCSKKNMRHTKQPTLSDSGHPIMAEFDFKKNQEAGLDPKKLTLGSNKKVHWVCHKCPKGQLHLFESSIAKRFGRKQGCPYCRYQKACICNSFKSLHPVLAQEWDTAMNNLSPDQVLPQSTQLIYWKNAAGHTWQQTPCARVNFLHKRVKKAATMSKLESRDKI